MTRRERSVDHPADLRYHSDHRSNASSST